MAYNKLSTANLPDPAIDPAQGSTPDQYFDVGIWTGDGVNGRNIADLYGHTPNWVWIKNRSAAIDHNVADVLRGWKELYPNLTNAEGSQQMNAPTNDGLSGLPASNGYNNNGDAYVSWAWKANGSGVSNTDGSITSTVSANTESGFSIGTFVGNQTAGATVGHGLSQAPEMIIIKDRPTVNDWPVYHTSISPSQTIKLNSTNAAFTESTIWNNTAPTTSVFTLGSSNLANNNTKSHVFYAFHSVEGFSKFGSYTGNGNADGTFVYTGFRPSWILFKRSDGGTHHWRMFDSTRSTFNDVDDYLTASSSVAEAVGKDVDFLSNGFKLRTTDSDVNLSGGTYIYMAFAENPFKYSNAR